MKKIFTSLCATLLAVAASAQVTATISPSDKNVFTPSEYDYVSVTYGDTLTLSSAVATVSYGTASTNVAVDSTTTLQALFDISEAVQTLNVPEGGVITVSVSGVSGASPVAADYKYYTTLPKPTASPADSTTLSSKTSSVTFTFSEPLVCPYIQYVSGNVYNTDTLSTTSSTSVTANIEESYWFSSASEITVSLVGVTDTAGYVYPPYVATYFYYVNTVNYLGVTVDPTEYTYQQVYDELMCVGFKFDSEVVMPESGSPAKVTFYRNGTRKLATVNIEDYDVYVDYVARAGYYVVTVYVPEVPSSASAYASAVVELQGFTYGGTLISQPSVTYYASLSSDAKAGGFSEIQNVTNTDKRKANVYTLQGVLVKENASSSELSSLAKGIYIVGGKKVIVK